MNDTKLIVIVGYESDAGLVVFLRVPSTMKYEEALAEWSNWMELHHDPSKKRMIVTPPEPNPPPELKFHEWLVKYKGAITDNSVEVW